MNCPCCSGKTYEECCKPYHTKEKNAPTAEALMRSRYSAFAIPNGTYLMETTAPSKRQFHNTNDLQEWGESNQWTKLSLNKVEFKAYYTDEDGRKQIHHELSTFKMIQNRWFYVNGEFLE